MNDVNILVLPSFVWLVVSLAMFLLGYFHGGVRRKETEADKVKRLVLGMLERDQPNLTLLARDTGHFEIENIYIEGDRLSMTIVDREPMKLGKP